MLSYILSIEKKGSFKCIQNIPENRAVVYNIYCISTETECQFPFFVVLKKKLRFLKEKRISGCFF